MPERHVEERRVAVIGSGFGGLGVAIRLQAAGFATTVFEARDKPGGRAYVYEDQGFVFDAGPTVITAPHCFDELFALAGMRTESLVPLLPVNPFYRLRWSDGDSFDYVGDGEAMRNQVRIRSPRDEKGYLQFVDYARRVFDAGYTDLASTPFLRFSDMVRVAPQLCMLRADRSVYGAVSSFVKDEKLRQTLSFHSLLVGGNPFETSAIYTLIHFLERKWGVYFPLGGTGALVRALCDVHQSLGGELRLSSPVLGIRTGSYRGRPLHFVTSATGRDEVFDAVVSNADIHHTYDVLYRGDSRAQATTRRLERMDWSMSLFVLYFGARRTWDVAHHTILFGPRYRELLADIFHGDRLPDDFSLYLHAPTVTDPSLAPPGCSTFYVLSPVPHLGNAPIDWSRAGPEYADRLLESLETVLPGLREHLVVKRWFTPEDFRTELRSHLGAAFSCAPTLTQSAWFRPHNRDPRIPGLYLVGAGTHPGAGVPGVLNGARATARLVVEDLAR